VYFMNDNYLVSLLCGRLGYVYIYILRAALRTLMSPMQMVVRVTFIPYMHVTLRLF